MSDSLLSKIGKDVLVGAEFGLKAFLTAEGYGQFITPFLPTSVASKIATVESKAAPVLSVVDDVVKHVQAVGDLGKLNDIQKFDTAVGLVSVAFSDAMSAAGHDIQDQDLFGKAQDELKQAIRLMVQARVDFLKSLKPKN